MAQGTGERKVALIKLADDVVRGERFGIIPSDTPTRAVTPIDAATAEAQLHALGCDAWTIAQMLRDARDAFIGLTEPGSGDGGPPVHE